MVLKNKEMFFQQIIDNMPELIAVIDSTGTIIFVNRQWSANHTGQDNERTIRWQGQSYFNACQVAAESGDKYAKLAKEGISSVVSGQQNEFSFEYPCSYNQRTLWFLMRIVPLQLSPQPRYLITHQDITERHLAEEKVACLVRQDSLTKLANRRVLDEFLEREWRRCLREKRPISVAMVDLDFFKQLNDNYGHIAGDDSLVKVSNLLKKFVNRAGDLCARYGGEEFILVWSETHACHGILLAKLICKEIERLQINNLDSTVSRHLTASIGIASCIPDENLNNLELIKAADKNLYLAKNNGRNQVYPN